MGAPHTGLRSPPAPSPPRRPCCFKPVLAASSSTAPQEALQSPPRGQKHQGSSAPRGQREEPCPCPVSGGRLGWGPRDTATLLLPAPLPGRAREPGGGLGGTTWPVCTRGAVGPRLPLPTQPGAGNSLSHPLQLAGGGRWPGPPRLQYALANYRQAEISSSNLPASARLPTRGETQRQFNEGPG